MLLSAHNASLALQQSCGVVACVALEWEWYLRRLDDAMPADNATRAVYLERIQQAGLLLHSVNEESGLGQVEAALFPTNDLEILVAQARALRGVAQDIASQMGFMADFSAKPFAQDYGSGIHIHVHLEGDGGNLLYIKQEGVLSAPLQQSLAGLLVTMPDYLHVFMPSEASWRRVVSGFHAPVTVSWGYNNRTTALRIPDGLGLLQGKEHLAGSPRSTARRIEHRVAGADANIEHVIAAVLQGIAYGITHHLTPPDPIYGDASLPMYELAPFYVPSVNSQPVV